MAAFPPGKRLQTQSLPAGARRNRRAASGRVSEEREGRAPAPLRASLAFHYGEGFVKGEALMHEAAERADKLHALGMLEHVAAHGKTGTSKFK